MASLARVAPPDQHQRERALDPRRSILVQAPAGSGKTDLLTRRFLRLLGEVADPSQIVAITFTKAAAAEMRHRILAELEKATSAEPDLSAVDEFSMASLAQRALERSRTLNWNLLELPAQLRISTIDSFCRELALQQPLLTGLGGALDVSEDPEELYRRAARQTLQQLAAGNDTLNRAIESLLLWRDNGWQELEGQLVLMLAQRDRWMHDFVLDRDPDWDALRQQLERPFARAVAEGLSSLSEFLDRIPNAANEAVELARFACAHTDNMLHRDLAELAELPCGPFDHASELESARQAYLCLAQMVLTSEGSFRKAVNKNHGFPPEQKRHKQRMLDLISALEGIPGLYDALQQVAKLPPARYPEDDWQIVRACFILLRHAAAELHVVFAEAGVVDFVEIAQRALRVLEDEERMPTDAALGIADGIHHLLIDEFQDTSRRQHRLLSSLVAAWPDTTARTVFVVGDPMQSIYFFRDADAELFPRVQNLGIELPGADPLRFDFVPLVSNFRTAPELVARLNESFEKVFVADDDSGIRFSHAQPARSVPSSIDQRFHLHLDFIPQVFTVSASDHERILEKQRALDLRESALESQTNRIVALIRSHIDRIEQARSRGEKYRIAVLGRTRAALAPVASALRNEAIPFRSVDLEQLSDRPEVLDVLALGRALLNAQDRVSWLAVLRAPWCGLGLDDLHKLTSSDDDDILRRPIPELLACRASLLSEEGQRAVSRLLSALGSVPRLHAEFPSASLGTRLQLVWHSLGGTDCVNATARANLDLLWSALDRLPDGEQDLLGPSLQNALRKLTALPDPSASGDHGVQLMTIHKSKGLEFEVVIVPELQAGCSRTRGRLLSWFERGIERANESGDVTEFLVAPLQSKGADRGKTKEWVDRVYRQRESQEMRRILYVAATRAREELHLFARPAYKRDEDGELTLCEPQESLFSTAWPALEEDVRARFDEWLQAQSGTTVGTIAASAVTNLIEMPAAGRPALLRRLPADYAPPPLPRSFEAGRTAASPANAEPAYVRHEGGILSRALGTAVHRSLEKLAHLRNTMEMDAARTSLHEFAPALIAAIRSLGIPTTQAESTATQAIGIAQQVSRDPLGAWIVFPHGDSASEFRWTGVLSGALRTVQVDRLFRAGQTPEGNGNDTWWIIDYKTAVTDLAAPDALSKLRTQFAPQLELYAELLRLLHGRKAIIRAGLYYPRMLQFDWWEL